MSALSVDTGRQMTPPLVDGVVHNRLVQFAPHGAHINRVMVMGGLNIARSSLSRTGNRARWASLFLWSKILRIHP